MMKKISLVLALLGTASPCLADTVIATQTLRPREVITADNIDVQQRSVQGAVSDINDAIGSEVKRAVYAGRPIMIDNLVKAAKVERNQIVKAVYLKHGLTIEVEARALRRGSAGEFIEAMNLLSHKKIYAEIQENGQLRVFP